MSDWDEQYRLEVGDDERDFTRRFALSGDKVSAAKGTLVPMDATDSVAKREAEKALTDPSVQEYTLSLMEQAGFSDLDIVKTLVRNTTARKMGIVQKTGDVVDIGEDGMVQIQATKMLAQMRGLLSGGAKVAETEKAPPKYELHFHNHEAPIDDEGDIDDGDVIEGEYTASPD